MASSGACRQKLSGSSWCVRAPHSGRSQTVDPSTRKDLERGADGSVRIATCTTLLRAFQRWPKAETEAEGGGATAFGDGVVAGSSGKIASSADESEDSDERDSKASSDSAVAAGTWGSEGDAEAARGRQGRKGSASGRQSDDRGPSSGSEAEDGRTTGKSGRGSLRPRAMGCRGRKPERTASTTRR